MHVSYPQTLFIIFVCAACTLLERALPFLIFGNRPVPKVIQYLGKVLPMAVMTTLVAYCIRDIRFPAPELWAPQLLSLAVVVLLHLWKRNTFLSIFAGTGCYMLLVQLVF